MAESNFNPFYHPKGEMCITCVYSSADCSYLPFHEMPVIGRAMIENGHDNIEVSCTHRIAIPKEPQEKPDTTIGHTYIILEKAEHLHDNSEWFDSEDNLILEKLEELISKLSDDIQERKETNDSHRESYEH